jgi:protein tyrosine kinase modulator
MNTHKQESGVGFGLGGLESFGLADYKRLLLSRKWTIISAALTIALITSVVAHFLPNRYKATTVIMIDPGKVPESYVKSTATLSAAARLTILNQEILSNTRLLQIIDELGLYRDLKNKGQEEILVGMRKDIEVAAVPLLPELAGIARTLTAFTVAYTSETPAASARVANRLASLFIEENMKSREEQVLGTAEFVDRQLEKTEKDLAEKGKNIQQLRTRFVSDLPESQNVHVQALASLQLELRAEMDGASRAQQQKMYLQSLLADTPAVVDLDTSGGSMDSGAQTQLARLQAEQDQLRSRYGPDYPDVKKNATEIVRLEQQIKEQEKSAASVPAPVAPQRHNPVIESQLAALEDEIQQHLQREKDLKAQIDYHQSKLELAPRIQQRLATATRDYDNAEQNYKRLQGSKFSADMSTDMETRQKSERFSILEPAQPPERPSQPNRLLISLSGLAGGLLIGLFSAVALEIMDTTVKTEREVSEQIQVPIFGEIGWLTTNAGRRRQRLRTLMATSGNAVLALAYLAVLVVSVK